MMPPPNRSTMASRSRSNELPGDREDHFATAQLIRRREDRALFREIAQRVRYLDFDEMKIEQFERVFGLVMLDEWSEADNAEKGERLGVEPKKLPWIRKSDEYERIRERVLEAFEYLKNPRRLDEHIEDPLVQDRIARETIRTALHSARGASRIKALEQINDRLMPVVREKGAQKVVMITEETARMLQMVNQEIHEIEGGVVEEEEEPSRTEEGSEAGVKVLKTPDEGEV